MIRIDSQVFGEIICSIPENVKTAYLTFDDGPCSELTPLILDILNKYDIKATFFITAKKAIDNKHITERIIREGHSIGNHTLTHNNFLTLSSNKKIFYEINEANKLLKKYFNIECRIFRPCAGLKDHYIMNIAKSLDMKVIGWSKRSFDTIYKDPDKLVKRFLSCPIYNGDIILFHDNKTRLKTEGKLKALQSVIEDYIEKGFIFKRI